MRRFMEDEFSFLFLNLDKVLKNSSPGKVAFIWHIERVQIDVITFERAQIHFFYRRFHCRRRRRCLSSLFNNSDNDCDNLVAVAACVAGAWK